MKADPKGVLTGTHVLSGNQACAEGALSAGCRFLGIYPVLPAQELSDRFKKSKGCWCNIHTNGG